MACPDGRRRATEVARPWVEIWLPAQGDAADRTITCRSSCNKSPQALQTPQSLSEIAMQCLPSAITRLTALTVLCAAATYSQAAIIFHSQFEANTTLQAPQDCITGSPYLCMQWITGTDTSTGYTWPPQLWGSPSAYAGGGAFQLISYIPGVTAATIGNYLSNRIVNVESYSGNATNKALYMEIKEAPNGQNPMGTNITQNTFQITPTSASQGDLYFNFRLRFQPGMLANMTGLNPAYGGIYGNGGTWRSFFEIKTGTPASTSGGYPVDNGDYRFSALIVTGCPPALVGQSFCPNANSNPAPYWLFTGDNVAGGGYPATNSWFVATSSTVVPIPDDGSWNQVQVFVHRSSGSDGRFWMAINGQTVVDRYGANTGYAGLPMNRIMPFVLYTGGRLPAYQWVDDVEVWLGMP
jgi:hypothetical protein